MIGIAATAPAGARFFDIDTPVTAAAARRFKSDGFLGCARYLSRSNRQGPGDLSAAEVVRLFAAGLAIVPVQHVRTPGWTAIWSEGIQDGHAAVVNAQRLGIPTGVVLWADLEGVAPGTDASNVIAWGNSWSKEVSDGGYTPGLYVGVDCGLTPDQLFTRLTVRHHWHAGSRATPLPATRGVQIVQTIPGGAYDTNVVQADHLGGLPIWWAPK